jgi:nucleoside-diphosphate-sugar epimerase
MSKVLVTGGSGFVGSHCILQLLQAGHEVRTTVRNLSREADVRAMLKVGGVDAGDRLSFVAADLADDAGWKEAAVGCEYVHHVASPFPLGEPKDENELIVPAREGALRVLRASRDAGVKRVVMTSSFAAIGYGHPPQTEAFDEKSWTDVSNKIVPAYHKSKALAERAAWDFIAKEGGKLELSVVNPVGIFGPVMGADLSSSIQIIKRMMDGGMPGCPRIYFGAVDVRDVADLHLRAMTHPAAKGERFIAVAGANVSLIGVAQVLKKGMGASAKRVSTKQIPDFVMRLFAIFDSTVRPALPELGNIKSASNEKAKRVLGWAPRSSEESILASAESLVQLGLLKK